MRNGINAMYQVEHKVMVGGERIIWYPSEYINLYNSGSYDGFSMKGFQFESLEDAIKKIKSMEEQLPRLHFRILDLETSKAVYHFNC